MYLEFDPFSGIYWSMFIFSLGLILSVKICTFFKVPYKFSLFLYLWHLLFCFVYFGFILNFRGDSIHYYIWGMSGEKASFLGTGFVSQFTGILIELGFSFLDCFLLFNFFGYIGLLAFTGSLLTIIQKKNLWVRILGYICILLPSVSFWTSGLGKDSLSFMATGLVLWSALNLQERKPLLFISILIMFFVRPHIGALLFVAFLVSLIFDKRTNIYSKVFLCTVSFILFLGLIPVLLKFVGLDEAGGVSNVDDYIEQRQSYNLEGGSSIDISSMSLPMQMLTYLFRPLPFEAHSLFALLASLDNVILLILFIFGSFAIIKKQQPVVESNRLFLWVYSYLSLFVLASTTANLGIAMRQKWMFLPCLIFLLLSVIGSDKISNKRI